jgi:hypothetical protein
MGVWPWGVERMLRLAQLLDEFDAPPVSVEALERCVHLEAFAGHFSEVAAMAIREYAIRHIERWPTAVRRVPAAWKERAAVRRRLRARGIPV